MTVTCPKCGKPFETDARTGEVECPHCGARAPVEAVAPTQPLPPPGAVPGNGSTLGQTERVTQSIPCPACGKSIQFRDPDARAECGNCSTAVLPAKLISLRGSHETPDTLHGRRLGEYVIGERLGTGGFGIVYRAKHSLLNREAAVKVLSPAIARDSDSRERFLREARLASSLEHPGIVQIFEAALDGDVLYIAMEMVRGRNLAEMVEEAGRLDPDEAARLISDTCAALHAAHEAGILHRDIKPENILVSEDGEVKLTDFGIARRLRASTVLTQPGVVVGTPGYLAPEILEGTDADQRADIYSLGATLYYLITGHHPYENEDFMALLFKRRWEQVRPAKELVPELPEALSDIASKMLAKTPAARYPSCAAVERDLRTHLSGGRPKVDVPAGEVPRHELPFGVVALKEHLVTEDQLLRCIRFQEQLRVQGAPVPPLGHIMVKEGLVSAEKIPRVLGLQGKSVARRREAKTPPHITVAREGQRVRLEVSGACGHDVLAKHLAPVMEGIARRSGNEVELDIRGLKTVATDTATEFVLWAGALRNAGKELRIVCRRDVLIRFERLGLTRILDFETETADREDQVDSPWVTERTERREEQARGPGKMAAAPSRHEEPVKARAKTVADYVEELSATDPAVRRSAARELAKSPGSSEIPFFIHALRDPDEEVRGVACQALERMTGTTYGYVDIAPIQIREDAVLNWQAWWKENGAKVLAGTAPGDLVHEGEG